MTGTATDWLKLKLPEKETKAELPAIGQSVALYCCPRDWQHSWSTPWRSDIGSLRMEEDTTPVWGSAIGGHSRFDGMKIEDILKKYELCFAEVSPPPAPDAEPFSSQGWLKAELSGSEPEIPFAGQPAVLCFRPRDRNQEWATDIGSLYVEEDALLWGSAFGIQSGFDGNKFEDILKDYDVCFAAVPPLEAGRFPSPLGISHEQRKENYRAHINNVLDNLK